jgi:hypothetical protein
MPIVEYQEGLRRFEHKAAMEDVGQRHGILNCCLSNI